MLGLGLTRFLPASGRVAISAAALRVGAAARAAHVGLVAAGRGDHCFQGRRVVVVGLLSSPSGLGRAARLTMMELAARGAAVLPVDMAARFGHRAMVPCPGACAPRDVTAWRPTDIVVQLNPPQFGEALQRFPVSLLRRVSIVGYWVWELARLPGPWRQAAGYCSEFWVPSEFVADALRDCVGGARPIRVMPHPVDLEPMPPRDVARGRAVRAKLGIAPGAFVAGTTWSMRSSFERKGAMNAVAAFTRAFPKHESQQTLLLRCLDGDVYPAGMRQVREAAAADDRIAVLDGPPLPTEVADFYNAIDVYLSLSRCEGYGLTIAEAAQAGLPVLATGWGLAADLKRRPGVVPVAYKLVPVTDPQGVYAGFETSVWAQPDVEEAGRYLQLLAGFHETVADPAAVEPSTAG